LQNQIFNFKVVLQSDFAYVALHARMFATMKFREKSLNRKFKIDKFSKEKSWCKILYKKKLGSQKKFKQNILR